jgi:hypothetical protein
MKVLNKRDVSASAGIYIGRGSGWGNPFVIGVDGDRAEVIEKYREWAMYQVLAIKELDNGDWLRALRGKDLICYCAPQACHGDVLLEMIEGE